MADGDLKIVDKSVQGEPEDLQTEADRRAQFLIVKSLTERFGNINIIGEEDVTSECSTVEKSFAAEVLQVEKDVKPELREVKPDEITVLIGIAHRGRPIAGVIHQPFHRNAGRTIWAIEGCGVHGIIPAGVQPQRVVVTTRSHLNQSVLDALNALKEKGLVDVVEKFGGAGYKVIKVLEGSAAYVFASAGGQLTDISGRHLCYEPTVQRNNTGGVLASASWDYILSIPKSLKDQLPEIAAKT
ncbi:unnamed protein product [Angiostrongylus costaricensis]|uniref:3'(2'),5'-bisphosphate nucleotidase n=1 Tax=Angiostrongylus costaricensis TaxID=334426 RepID=A0A0R3PFG1_ANGCS|nr:unnamed protein product [Angiostrongylus costaricensis]